MSRTDHHSGGNLQLSSAYITRDMDLHAQLLDVEHVPMQKDKLSSYKSILDTILFASSNIDELEQKLNIYVDAILQEHIGLVVSRQALTDFITAVDERVQDAHTKKEAFQFAINRIQSRVVSFEEQVQW